MTIQVYQSEDARREWVEWLRREVAETPGDSVRWNLLFGGTCSVDKGTARRFLAHVDAGGSLDIASFLSRQLSEQHGASITLPF
jgi:hypothetical protein